MEFCLGAVRRDEKRRRIRDASPVPAQLASLTRQQTEQHLQQRRLAGTDTPVMTVNEPRVRRRSTPMIPRDVPG